MADFEQLGGLGGLEVIISEMIPKIEEFTLEYKRSFLNRLFSGRLHDIRVTEEDQIFLMKVPRDPMISLFGNGDEEGQEPTKNVLLVNHSMWTKIQEALSR